MSRIMDVEFEQLKKETLRMGQLAKKSIGDTLQALIRRDVKLAQKIIKGSSVVDKLEFDIERRCMKLLALHQPVAKDLRTAATILKIITDLDRINDHAKDIGVITIAIGKEPFVKPLIDIPRMAEIAQGMIEDCLEAFSTEKFESLKDFSKRDDEVDGLMDQVRRELITIMIENPSTIAASNRLLFVGLHLERVADHACNVASRIFYMITGKRVKFE